LRGALREFFGQGVELAGQHLDFTLGLGTSDRGGLRPALAIGELSLQLRQGGPLLIEALRGGGLYGLDLHDALARGRQLVRPARSRWRRSSRSRRAWVTACVLVSPVSSTSAWARHSVSALRMVNAITFMT
jgi:hypothetical protein